MRLNLIFTALLILVFCLLIQNVSNSAYAARVIYDAAGTYNFTVPDDVTSLTIKAWGAGGGGSNVASTGKGGGGGFAQTTISVTPDQIYKVVVGENGKIGQNGNSTGGTNGGGNGGVQAGSGGGYSGVFLSTVSSANTMIIAAGGGGGANADYGNAPLGQGGPGGGSTGGTGNGPNAGTGGTQSAGGSSGGGQLSGGVGTAGTPSVTRGSGGGGSGYYGGGGGSGTGSSSSAGGGGSNYVNGTNTTSIQASGSTVANNSDTDYPGSHGNGGSQDDGQDGLVVILYNQTSNQPEQNIVNFVLVATADLSKQKNNLGTNYTDIYNGSFEPDFNLINFTGYSKVRILSGWDYNDGDTGNQKVRWVDTNNNTQILYESSTFTTDQDPNDSGWISLPTWAKNETSVEWQGKSSTTADDPVAKYFRIFLRR